MCFAGTETETQDKYRLTSDRVDNTTMSGDRYELGRRRLLQATCAGVAGAISLSTGVGAATARSADEAPDEDEFEEILSAMDGDGSESAPYVVTDVVELQAMSGDVTAYYELGNDIDASATSEWNDGTGFEPIFGREQDAEDDEDDDQPAEQPLEFVGSFQGNDHEITGLTIDDPDMFGAGLLLANEGVVLDVTLTDVSIAGGAAGGITVLNSGGIGRTTVDGTVDGTDPVGGVAGQNNGRVVDCETQVAVTGEEQVGGLVGTNTGQVSSCVAKGNVEGSFNTGGFVGQTSGAIETSSAEGAVSGQRRVGGFAGDVSATMIGCTASGDVAGETSVGGFAGESWGSLLGVTAEGATEGDEHIGGLVGENHGEIRVCSTLGDVLGSSNVGGIVGWGNAGTIVADSYSFGSVDGDSAVGALVGLLGWEFLSEGETAGVRRGYWNVDATEVDPIGRTETGDGEVAVEEDSIAGLERTQFTGEDVVDHMTVFDFDQQWRPFPDSVPSPRSQTPSVFEIIEISSTEIVVTEDEVIDIELEIENTAEWEGTQSIALVVNDELIETRDLTLDVGESEHVAFDEIPATSFPVGSHTFAVQTRDDEVDGTIEVESASSAGDDDDGSSEADGSETPADGTGGGSDDADDDGAGFGLGAALTGVGTGAYLLARRFDSAATSEE